MTVDFFKQKYGYEIEGVWMPRVTAVTALVSKTNSFALSRIEGFQASADWGTLVHLTIGRMLQGEDTAIDSRIVPSIEIFKEWQKTNGLEIENPKECIEKRVFDNEHWYAGTVDLIAKVNGTPGIIDIKTGTGIREEHSLQTAAYFAAYNKSQSMYGQAALCKTRWILRIDQYDKCKGCFAKKREKSKKPSITGGNPFCNHQWSGVIGEIEFKELPNHEHDIQAFLAAKGLWEWLHRDWLGRIGNYPKKLKQKTLI